MNVNVRNTHEPIISRSDFEHVQELIRHRQRPSRHNHPNLFKEILRCKNCGRPLNLYYNKRRSGRKAYCPNCGCRLKKERNKKVIDKNNKDFKNYKVGGSTPLGMNEIILTYYLYHCPQCNIVLTYDEYLGTKNNI